MQASDEPMVEHPIGLSGSGAFQKSAMMSRQRSSSWAVCGYSSRSMRFLSAASAISLSAWGSIHVVPKVATLSRE